MLKLLQLWSNHSRNASINKSYLSSIYSSYLPAAAPAGAGYVLHAASPKSRKSTPTRSLGIERTNRAYAVIPQIPQRVNVARASRIVVAAPEEGTRSWRPGCHGKHAVVEAGNTVVFEAV